MPDINASLPSTIAQLEFENSISPISPAERKGLTVQVPSGRYNGFKTFSIERSVENLSSVFDITFMHDGFSKNPFVANDEITIYINDIPILTGYIEILRVSYGDEDHSITVTGRDKTCDLIDSTVGSKIELKAPISLEDVILKASKAIEMTGIKVINTVGDDLEYFTKGEVFSAEVDTKIFDFLEQYSRKRQVLMTTDGKGNVVLARSGRYLVSETLQNLVDKDNELNNILEASVTYDYSDRYYLYRVSSQSNPSSMRGQSSGTNKSNTNKVGVAFDPQIRKSRVLDITAESSSDSATVTQRALWEAAIRRARSMTYTATVQGFEVGKTGKPWEPNTLVKVLDDFCLIDATLLVKSVTYTLDLSGGSRTQLELVYRDSYLPEPLGANGNKHDKIGKKRRKRKGRRGTEIDEDIVRFIQESQKP